MIDGHDFKRNIDREEFAKLNESIMSQIAQILFASNDKFKGEDFEIELFGEATRMPFIMDIIKSVMVDK